MTRSFRDIPLYAQVSEAQWRDWRWQAQHCITDLETLGQLFTPTEDEIRGVRETFASFRFSLTPYYALLADADDPACPVRMQAIPIAKESQKPMWALRDPLGEDKYRPVPALVHRYPDRALLLLNNQCGVYCRYCTRKRLTGLDNEALSTSELGRALAYLRATPQIRDVIVSGGEPLLLSDTRLDQILGALRSINTVEIVRIHTRAPVVLPQRVTPDLTQMLRKHQPLWVITHFNHPKELTEEAQRACTELVDAGIPLGNQTVLLRRVNSSAKILKDLFHRLVRIRVWPYYLHQCDLAEGLEHFRTPINKGIEIMEQLYGWTSGFAIPRFVIDTPGGGGKVPLIPEYLLSRGEAVTTLRNYQGLRFDYPEPLEQDCTVPYETTWFANLRRKAE